MTTVITNVITILTFCQFSQLLTFEKLVLTPALTMMMKFVDNDKTNLWSTIYFNTKSTLLRYYLKFIDDILQY
jgi:hypothetical protein